MQAEREDSFIAEVLKRGLDDWARMADVSDDLMRVRRRMVVILVRRSLVMAAPWWSVVGIAPH
jgi:hypothetical protein